MVKSMANKFMGSESHGFEFKTKYLHLIKKIVHNIEANGQNDNEALNGQKPKQTFFYSDIYRRF